MTTGTNDQRQLDRFVADAARMLGGSLDVEATLHQIADLAVPDIADWCAVDLLDADGVLVSVAVAHRDPAMRGLVAELRRDYPADPAAPVGAYRVAREGRSMTLEVTPAVISGVARSPRHAELLDALELSSWMGVPMLAGGRVLGTIAFAGDPARGPYGPEHLAAAEALGMRAAAALANAQAFSTADRFRRMLDAVSEAIFLVRPADAVVIDVNKGALDLLGAAPDGIVGHAVTTIIPSLDPEPLRDLVAAIAADRSGPRRVDAVIARTVGPDLPVEILIQRVELPTDGPAVVMVARDIRDRKDAEVRLLRLAEAEHARAAELQAVIGAIGDGVLVLDADGTVVLRNPAAAAVLHAEPATYVELITGFDDADGKAPRLGTHGGPVALAARGDPDRWIEVATYPVGGDRDPGRPDETIVVVRDVSDARRRDAIRETFIGVLSHELRTPITTIYGGAKLLARPDSTVDAETRRAVFDDVVAESERLLRLVEDVVAMNRFGEADGGDLGKEPVLLQRIIPGVAASEAARWPEATFATDVLAGLPTVVADPVYVEQVVRNLLSNAAKYGGPGVTVRIGADAVGDEVVTRIVDDGPGIAPDEVDRLFDLFYRSTSTADTTAGAGIGLFVCARLVRAMGGRIWVEPGVDGGAQFAFALRVMPDD